MKKSKKILGLMMCVVLVLGCMTGCGKKSDEELLTSSVTALNKAKSFEADVTMKGKMSVKLGEESQDMDINMTMNQTQFTDPMKAKTTMNVDVMGQKTTAETYMQKDGDKYVVYTGANGTWTKMSLGNLDEAMKSMGADIGSQFSDDVKKYTKKEDKTEGEKTYLVYDYTVSAEEIQGMLEGMTSSLGSMMPADESKEIMDTIVKSIGDITMTIWIDRETENIYRVECPMTDMMNNMFDAVINMLAEQTSQSDEEDSMGVAEALSQMEFSVSDMNMVMNYKNLDAATEFEIPQAALDAEEVSVTE